MKKIILSCSVFLLMLANTSAQAINMAAVKHAHPLPNLMLVMIEYGEKLNLSEEQQAKLKAWGKEHKPKAKQLVKGIIKAENAIHDAALAGTAKAELMSQLDALLEKRKALAELKTNCRDKMRDVLSDEQWQQVLDYYHQM
jgi:Spy/CpxP family protein refolding chaperone